MEKAKYRTFLILGFCAAGLSQLLFVGEASSEQFGQLIYAKNSLYHRILVYQRGPVVTLRFDKQPKVQIQSQVNLDDLHEHMLEYTALSFCGLLYQPTPKRILVLGLGGGVIPRDMHSYLPEAEIDVAEIDPEIPKIAKHFFGFNEDDKLKTHISDGRMFIREQLRRREAIKYDIVILDAFSGDYIPFHLMTREFLEEVNDILSADGVVVANVFYNNRLFDAELKTFLDVFGRCQVFYGARSVNAMLVSPGPKGRELTAEEAMSRAGILQREHRFSFDITNVASRLKPGVYPEPRAKVLTDDRAPVNWLREQEKRK